MKNSKMHRQVEAITKNITTRHIKIILLQKKVANNNTLKQLNNSQTQQS